MAPNALARADQKKTTTHTHTIIFITLKRVSMRIFTFLALLLLGGFSASAQVVLVNSPESLAGNRIFSAAGFGADLTSDIWTGDVVFVNDGSANPNQGCNAAMNAGDIAGKIALVDRGSCEFGLKCLNAEQAGAIAVIVFNNAANAGSIVMGAGVNGGAVTIPCVMLSFEDGQAFRAELATGPINVSIGAIRFNNDIATDRASISNAPLGVVPISQMGEAEQFVLLPGVAVTNTGINAATGVTATATITSGGATLYQETGTLSEVLDSDSTRFISLPSYDASLLGTGLYELSYTISSDSVDALPGDNGANGRFVVSENVYNKGGWDLVNNRPAITTGYTIGGGGNIEFLSPFYVPNGLGFVIDSVQFNVSTAAGNMIGEQAINAYVYEWTDANSDGVIQEGELTIVALADDIQHADPAATTSWVKHPFIDFDTFEEGYTIPDDDKYYVVGVRYEGANLVFFGFDENNDQTQYLNQLGADATDFDLPYIGINAFTNGLPDVAGAFLFTGLRAPVSTGLVMSEVEVSATDRPAIQISINAWPNPVSERLTADIRFEQPMDNVEYRIVNIKGHIYQAIKRDRTEAERAEFDVSQLPAGQYYFVVRTAQGNKATPFVIQH